MSFKRRKSFDVYRYLTILLLDPFTLPPSAFFFYFLFPTFSCPHFPVLVSEAILYASYFFDSCIWNNNSTYFETFIPSSCSLPYFFISLLIFFLFLSFSYTLLFFISLSLPPKISRYPFIKMAPRPTQIMGHNLNTLPSSDRFHWDKEQTGIFTSFIKARRVGLKKNSDISLIL